MGKLVDKVVFGFQFCSLPFIVPMKPLTDFIFVDSNPSISSNKLIDVVDGHSKVVK